MDPINKLQAQVAELLEWKRVRETQQFSHPIDDVSLHVLNAATYVGPGTHALTRSAVDSNGDTVTVNPLIAGTEFVMINNNVREIVYL